MTKFKSIGRLALIICLIVSLAICPLFMGGAAIVHADEQTEQETPVTGEIEGGADKADEPEGNGLQSLVDGFLAQLKEKYGDDYETYYNAILEEWGSVEAYLLSLVDDGTIPDAAANGWKAFVKWLGDYAPIWGSILAVIALIIVIVLGRKALKRVAGFVTISGGKFRTLFSCVNKMYQADLAEMQALIKLLGENERFAEEREELQKAIEEIEKDDE